MARGVRYSVDVVETGGRREKRWPDLVLERPDCRVGSSSSGPPSGRSRVERIVAGYRVAAWSNEVRFFAGDVQSPGSLCACSLRRGAIVSRPRRGPFRPPTSAPVRAALAKQQPALDLSGVRNPPRSPRRWRAPGLCSSRAIRRSGNRARRPGGVHVRATPALLTARSCRRARVKKYRERPNRTRPRTRPARRTSRGHPSWSALCWRESPRRGRRRRSGQTRGRAAWSSICDASRRRIESVAEQDPGIAIPLATLPDNASRGAPPTTRAWPPRDRGGAHGRAAQLRDGNRHSRTLPPQAGELLA